MHINSREIKSQNFIHLLWTIAAEVAFVSHPVSIMSCKVTKFEHPLATHFQYHCFPPLAPLFTFHCIHSSWNWLSFSVCITPLHLLCIHLSHTTHITAPQFCILHMARHHFLTSNHCSYLPAFALKLMNFMPSIHLLNFCLSFYSLIYEVLREVNYCFEYNLVHRGGFFVKKINSE